MTNGEKMHVMFPSAEIEEEKDGNDVWIAIDYLTNFTKDWWNTEYKEPTKNDLGVDTDKLIADCEKMSFDIDFFNKPLKVVALDAVKNIANELPSVTPQEPTIITCKDCKYYRNKGNKHSYCTKRLNVDSVTDRYREPNFYCADAVLREVEE